MRGTGGNKHKVYTMTKKGINYGGLGRELQKFTGGPKDNPLSSYISLADLHGDLSIKFEIKEIPEEDNLPWKGPIELNNGVKQKVAHLWARGDKIAVELYHGCKNPSVILKPSLIAEREDRPEDLIETFINVAYDIRRDLEREGYRLNLDHEQNGEGKFTIRSKALDGIGYYEGENFIIDQSKGEPEIHPKTGDLETNKTMSDMILNLEEREDQVELLDDQDKLDLIDEVGELSNLIKNVKETRDKIERTDKKTNIIADNVSDLAKSLNQLMDMLGVDQESRPDPGGEAPEDPGGLIYG